MRTNFSEHPVPVLVEEGIIPHHFVNSSEQPGQCAAEQCDRQAVTARWLWEHPDLAAWMYVPRLGDTESWVEITGVDATVKGPLMIILNVGRTGERPVLPDTQLFVQNRDLLQRKKDLESVGSLVAIQRLEILHRVVLDLTDTLGSIATGGDAGGEFTAKHLRLLAANALTRTRVTMAPWAEEAPPASQEPGSPADRG